MWTNNRNEYLKTQTQIMAYMGKIDENTEFDDENTNPHPDIKTNPGTNDAKNIKNLGI